VISPSFKESTAPISSFDLPIPFIVLLRSIPLCVLNMSFGKSVAAFFRSLVFSVSMKMESAIAFSFS